MKIKSIITTCVCFCMILSILIPAVMGMENFESRRTQTYDQFVQSGFRDSNIHSELLSQIEKGYKEEVGIILTVNKGMDKQNVEKALRKADAKGITHHRLINAYSATIKLQQIQQIAGLLEVEKVFPDFKIRVLLDESVPIIGANNLWSRYTGSGITVAVLDTGVDSDHPDLKNKVIDQVSLIEGETPEDGFGHGTHVAGIVTGSGVASEGQYKGVAPEASIINVKVLDSYGSGTASSVMSGIEYAVDHGAHIISMSLGAYMWPPDGSDPVAMTANAAVDEGVVVIAAAGNAGAPFYIASPASAEKVIAVGATTKEDNIALYSSMGPSWDHRIKPEVVAPGGADFVDPDPAGLGIVSAMAADSLLARWMSQYMVDKYYMSLSGTSMATPHVSGVAALMLQAHPAWTPEQIRQQLMNTGSDLGYDPTVQGAGRIDAVSAVDSTLSIAPAALSYVAEPDESNRETLSISNTGTEKLEVYLGYDGDVEVDFKHDTIMLNPAQTKTIHADVGVPAGSAPGLHYGSILINREGQTARLPILISTPMTFVGGTSRFWDGIEQKPSEFYSIGFNYYYFNVPEEVPGISSAVTFNDIPGWVNLYLISPEGEFVDYDSGWESETELAVSAVNPVAGRWMIMIEASVFDSMIETLPMEVTTHLASLSVEPASWNVPSVISSGTDVDQTFTITNNCEQGKSVQVEGYMSVVNFSAGGSFYGSVDYVADIPEPVPEPVPERVPVPDLVPVPEPIRKPIYETSGLINVDPGPGKHYYTIPPDTTEYSLTMTALNNTAVLAADIFDPNGMWVEWLFFGLWEPSTASVRIKDPIPGKWRVVVWPLFAENDTTEYYRGDYEVVSKDPSWIAFTPGTLFVPAMAEREFISTLIAPYDANGHYTGEITVSGSQEIFRIPVSISMGQNVTFPGDFTGNITNNDWRYYTVDVDSDHLNASVSWDDITNDLDLFAFDPSGEAVASSTESGTTYEELDVQNPATGTWTVRVYGYEVSGIQYFTGTVD